MALAAAGNATANNPDLQTALKLAANEKQPIPALLWLKLRLVELAAQAGVDAAQVEPVIALRGDP